jgi:glucokinase
LIKFILIITYSINGVTLLQKSVLSLDMGGTKILASIINSKEGIVARIKKATDPNSSKTEYIDTLAGIVNDVINEADIKEKHIEAVCLGVPGSVNPYTGVIGLAPNLGLKDFNIKEKLQERVSIPVLVENDVNLGALGIKNFGVGKKAVNMLAVFIGTGIGGGLILEGKIYRGSKFVAGEIGHVLVDKNGPVCGCGNRGCFEAIASRTAIVNKIIDDIKSGKKSELTDMVKAGERIKSKSLAKAVANDDKVVIKRISDGCDVIGGVLASLSNFMNFDLIVLGGGLIEALDSFILPKIEIAFYDHVLNSSTEGLKIVPSILGDDAAIWGGIALAEEFLDVKV